MVLRQFFTEPRARLEVSKSYGSLCIYLTFPNVGVVGAGIAMLNLLHEFWEFELRPSCHFSNPEKLIFPHHSGLRDQTQVSGLGGNYLSHFQ